MKNSVTFSNLKSIILKIFYFFFSSGASGQSTTPGGASDGKIINYFWILDIYF
jgi:hypothetical protein